MFIALLWVTPWAALVSAIIAPSTDLDTLPVVYMGGNTLSRPKASVEMLAKMRYIVIEKWEGPCWKELTPSPNPYHLTPKPNPNA